MKLVFLVPWPARRESSLAVRPDVFLAVTDYSTVYSRRSDTRFSFDDGVWSSYGGEDADCDLGWRYLATSVWNVCIIRHHNPEDQNDSADEGYR
jgi:hypothetical protein